MKRTLSFSLALMVMASAANGGPLEDAIAAQERKDFATALALYRQLATQGDARGQRQLAHLYATGQGVPKDDEQAAHWYQRAAEQGDAAAQLSLGVRHAHGRGVPRDLERAIYWVRKSAEQGYAPAQNTLGIRYELGQGVPKDLQQAVDWYQKAADQGHADAQNNLGLAHQAGMGVPKDNNQAVLWYRKAADQGLPAAQTNLGVMYTRGEGVPKNDEQAAHWYRKAADQGDALGQFNLSIAYADGRGVPKDDQQALFWCRRAAEQGRAAAQNNLGFMYFNGQGTPRDPEQGVFWYRKAADQGLAMAQGNLGIAYAIGQGAPKDEQRAYFWLLLASANGYEPAARRRDLLERDLPAAQRAAAQAAARTWRPGTSGEPTFADNLPSASQGTHANASGSGFRIAPGYLITNRHVIAGCTRLRVDGQLIGQVVAHDERNDIALVRFPRGSGAVASIRAGRPRLGEAVTAAGYPLQGLLTGLSATNGNVSRLSGMGGDTRMIQISAPVQPGNSGGPLLDASGSVIGVVVAKLDALKVASATGDIPQNVNFALNSNVLRSFLDANNIDYRDAPPGPALPPADIADRAKAFTVLIECWR